jgi:periplasmic protein TonB
MKPEMILQADVLDILFENRNKEYGAYALRKEYSRTLSRSLGGVLFILLMGFFLLYWKNSNPPQHDSVLPTPITDTVKLIDVPVDPPPPKTIQTQPQPPARIITDPPPRIVPDIEKTKPIPTVDERQSALIGDKTTDGPPVSTETILPPISKGNGNGNPKPEQPAVVEPPVLEVADVYPEFPGGDRGWRMFLERNLRHPDMPENESWKIKVVVRFIVNEDGSISGLEIIQSGGTEFDKEVRRVFSKSPKWIAGSDKGKKVKIYRTQPVIFANEIDK